MIRFINPLVGSPSNHSSARILQQAHDERFVQFLYKPLILISMLFSISLIHAMEHQMLTPSTALQGQSYGASTITGSGRYTAYQVMPTDESSLPSDVSVHSESYTEGIPYQPTDSMQIRATTDSTDLGHILTPYR